MEGRQEGGLFSQGNSMSSNEVGRQEGCHGWWQKIRCFGDVQREQWMRTDSCKVRGTAHAVTNGDTISPKHRIRAFRPLRLVPVNRLEQSLTQIEIRLLNETVGVRVVAQNPDVGDMVLS